MRGSFAVDLVDNPEILKFLQAHLGERLTLSAKLAHLGQI